MLLRGRPKGRFGAAAKRRRQSARPGELRWRSNGRKPVAGLTTIMEARFHGVWAAGKDGRLTPPRTRRVTLWLRASVERGTTTARCESHLSEKDRIAESVRIELRALAAGTTFDCDRSVMEKRCRAGSRPFGRGNNRLEVRALPQTLNRLPTKADDRSVGDCTR